MICHACGKETGGAKYCSLMCMPMPEMSSSTMGRHGGKREGAGRPLKPVEERTRPVTVWITDEQRQWLKEQGGLNHIRTLITDAMGRG